MHVPPQLEYVSRADALAHHMPGSAKAGLTLGLLGGSLTLALVLGLYRDEVKALVFVPGVLALAGLPLTIAGVIRRRGRLPLAPTVLSLLLNTLLLAATALLIYVLSLGFS